MSSTQSAFIQTCPICANNRTIHNPFGNAKCYICNDCYKSRLGGLHCFICESKKFDDYDKKLLDAGINESLMEDRKIQAARNDAVKAKKAQETADHALAHQLAMLDLQIADQSSSSSSYSASSQASRPVSSQASLPASSQASRPVSSQAPHKSVKTVGMFDKTTHRRVKGNGACFFTSVWYLLYGSGGMTSSGDVLQISDKQLLCLKQEVLDYLRGLVELSNNQFKLDELALVLQSVGLKKTIAEYTRDLMNPRYWGGSVELSIIMKCHAQQVGIALINMDQTAPDLSPVFHSPNRSGHNYRLGVLLFSGAHYELMINPSSHTGTFDVTHSYVMNDLKNIIPEIRQIALRLKRGGK